ncbi:Pentatricopeptide repeat-containing protein, mitochondrial, partial [Mucuna pruriens]
MNTNVVRTIKQVGGGGGITPTCVHWLAGRCNKKYCKFLHINTPSLSSDSKTKLASIKKGGEDETSVVKVFQQSASRICKYWTNGNCAHGEGCLNLHSWSDGILVSFHDNNTRQVWWTAPPESFIKINCDGAFCHNVNKAAIGGVVRDWKGKFIFGFSGALRNCNSVVEAELCAIKIGMDNCNLVVEAELCAIKIGMEMTLSKEFKNLITESDSWTAIKFINGGVLRSHPHHHLVSSILQIGDKVDHVYWNHIFREINSVADGLAKNGLSSSPRLGVKFFNSPPSFILMSLCADDQRRNPLFFIVGKKVAMSYTATTARLRSAIPKVSVFLRLFSDSPKQNAKKNSGFDAIDNVVALFTRLITMHPLPSAVELNMILGSIVKMKHYPTAISLSKQIGLRGISPSIVTLSILINCYCHLGHMGFAFSVLSMVLKRGYQPNAITLTTLIQGLCINGEVRKAMDFYDRVVAQGFVLDEVSYGTLINGLCKIGQTRDAFKLLQKMEGLAVKPNVVIYNMIIDGLCKDGLVTEARDLYSEIVGQGMDPDIFTYTCLIHGFCSLGKWGEVTLLLCDMVDKKVNPNVYTYNILIDALCKKRMLGEAQDMCNLMIDRGQRPDVVTFNTLMSGYCLYNDVDEARKLFDTFVEWGIMPDVWSYNILIIGYCKSKRIDEALSLFNKMNYTNLVPNIITYSSVIDGLCKSGRISYAWELFSAIHDVGPSPNVITYNIMLDALCKVQHIDKAIKLFNLMFERGLTPNVSSYNILINGYCKSKRIDEAMNLLKEMHRRNLVPDSVTYNSLIDGLCKSGRISHAWELFNVMHDSGPPVNMHFAKYNMLSRQLITKPRGLAYYGFSDCILIDEFCKGKRMKEAMNLFRDMGLSYGNDKAEELLQEMSETTPTCVYWLAGTCNRNPCRFLHTEIPSPSSDCNSKSTMVKKSREDDTGVVKTHQKSSSRICKYWANGNCTDGEQCMNLHSWFDGILVHFQEDNPKPIRLVWWTAPPNNFVKISCDGAFSNYGNKAAVGGVVRDWEGKFIVGFSSALGDCGTVVEAELLAIKIGMETAVSRGFRNLVVESDSYTAIEFINSGVPQSHPHSHLVSSILQISNKADHVCWNHVFREINSVADCLAKHGLSSSPDLGVIFFESPPPFIVVALCADEAGNHVFREINSVADGLAKNELSSSPRLGVKFFKSPPSFILMSLCGDEVGVMYSR